jgi:hypothetical protein
MKKQSEILKLDHLSVIKSSYDGGYGLHKEPLTVVWSVGGGWEHVSVSYRKQCPTWEEMCRVKDMFFEPEEVVVQYHPRHSEYVNRHPYCLHLWRKRGEDFETPPMMFV